MGYIETKWQLLAQKRVHQFLTKYTLVSFVYHFFIYFTWGYRLDGAVVEADNGVVQVGQGLDDFNRDGDMLLIMLLLLLSPIFEALRHRGAAVTPSKRAPYPSKSWLVAAIAKQMETLYFEN